MIESRNSAKDPWPTRLKTTVNCTGALAGDAKYYTYTLTDPTQQGTIAWCNMIESKADWIAGTCMQESLMRLVMAPGCPPLKLHHVGVYTMDDWQELLAKHDAGKLVEPWFAPPINGPGNGVLIPYTQ